MKPIPTDPMALNDALILALCDDLFDLCVNRRRDGKTDTPRADRIAEIARQMRERNAR